MMTTNRRLLLQGALTAGAAVVFGRASQVAAATAGASAPTGDPLSYVNPQFRQPLETVFKAVPEMKLDTASLAARRSFRFPGMPQPAATPPWERRLIKGRGGAPDVPVFVINGGARGTARPAILQIHGGGYVTGRAEDAIVANQAMARELDCVIVSVDYRLAPETPFPGSLEDNYAALKWLHDQAATLGADPARIAVMGESAGGGHAAMLAIAARDRGEVPLAGQVLIYPMLDDRTGSTRAVPAHIGHYVWTPESNRFGWTALLGRPAGSARVPYGAVPARVADLAGLPPAFIGVGSIDLFVQEDVEYANRLIGAGVPTELYVVPGGYHGFDFICADAPLARQFRAAWLAMLRRVFQPT